MSISLPLDDGFLRRECPSCGRQFKWHHGPTDDRPEDAVDTDVYFCPYCGYSAPIDQWWTSDQVEYIEQIGLGEATRAVGDMFEDLERQTRSNSMIQFKATSGDAPEPPDMMHEPSDMMVVESPCHPWEPIKAGDDWDDPLHCLICGEEFAI
jgi:Zn ribbon nucleic-acid-binding protein